MSLSNAPSMKITSVKAQEIADEILGGTIHFCRETGYKQSITMFTFFWSAFLVAAQKELDEDSLIKKVISCYTHSLSCVVPKLLTDAEMRQGVNELCHQYWSELSSNFYSITTEEQLSAFFQNANNLDKQALNQFNCDPSKIFIQISKTINLTIYRILHNVSHGLSIQYKNILNDFRATKKQTKQSSTVSAAYSHDSSERSLGMAWYEFLRYFALFAGAVSYVVNGYQYASGSIYSTSLRGLVTAEQVYAFYGDSLRTADSIYAIFLFVFAFFALAFRHCLAKFDRSVLDFVKIYYGGSGVAALLYTIAVSTITGEFLIADGIGSLIASLIFLFANLKYFKKRAHLFVGNLSPSRK